MLIIAVSEGFPEAVQHLLGFVFVLTTLTALWLITESIGIYFKKRASAEAQQDFSSVETKPKPRPAVFAQTADNVTEDELAAITGCIMAIMGSNSHIVSVRSSNAGWGHEGRRDHFASHRIR